MQSSNSISGNVSKGSEKVTQQDICTPKFIAALFTIAKTWKQSKHLLMDEWINKVWHIFYMYGILFHHKKWGNPVICDNIDEPWRHYAKLNVWQRKKNTVWSHFYVESKNKHTNSYKKRSNLWLPEVESGGKENLRKVVKRYKLLVIRYASSSDVMCNRMTITDTSV